jgi:hypothetical protein
LGYDDPQGTKQGEFIMLTTSNLLTAFMLGGWLAVTPAAMAAKGNYTIHGGVIQGNAQVGELRMAGTIPIARNLRTNTGRRWSSQTHYQARYGRGTAYANLNQ